MSPLAAMWIASILGAVLFFIAGFLTAGRGPDTPRSVDDALPGTSTDHAPVAQTEQTITRLKNERAELKQLVTELESQVHTRAQSNSRLARRVTELEQELEQKAESVKDMFDYEATRIRPGTSSDGLEELLASQDADSIAELLQTLEQQLAQDETWQAATLADDLGMPVVGVGDHNDALAVFSSTIAQVESSTSTLLPLKKLRRLTIEDTDGVVVSSCTLPDRRLSLVTLTQHATPSTPALTALLEQTARVL